MALRDCSSLSKNRTNVGSFVATPTLALTAYPENPISFDKPLQLKGCARNRGGLSSTSTKRKAEHSLDSDTNDASAPGNNDDPKTSLDRLLDRTMINGKKESKAVQKGADSQKIVSLRKKKRTDYRAQIEEKTKHMTYNALLALWIERFNKHAVATDALREGKPRGRLLDDLAAGRILDLSEYNGAESGDLDIKLAKLTEWDNMFDVNGV